MSTPYNIRTEKERFRRIQKNIKNLKHKTHRRPLTPWGHPPSGGSSFGSGGGISATTLAALTDTDIPTTTPDQQVLTWVAAESKWKPKSPAVAVSITDFIDDLIDFTTTVGTKLKNYLDGLYTNATAVATQIADAVVGFATEAWVTAQKFLTDVAADIQHWWDTYIGAPWGRGINILDSLDRVIWGEKFNTTVSINGTRYTSGDTVPDNLMSHADLNSGNTESKTFWGFLADHSSEIATVIRKWWTDATDTVIAFLRDTVGGTLKNIITEVTTWWNNLSYPWKRGSNAGVLDSLARVIWGERFTQNETIGSVQYGPAIVGKMNVTSAITANSQVTSSNTKARTIWEFFGDSFTEVEKFILNWWNKTTNAAIKWLRDLAADVAGTLATFFSGAGQTLEQVKAAVSKGIDDALKTGGKILAKGYMAITSFGSTFINWVNAQTSGIGKIIHDLFDFLGITLPTTNPDGTITPGDIDLGTRDISNVDRIFFNSNDSVDTSSPFAHITAYGGTMIAYIPNSTSQFKIYIPKFPRGNSEVDVGNHFGVRSDLGFTVAGAMTSKANGAIWLDGKTVKIKSDDLEHSISDIGTGGGGTGTPSSSSPSTLPILKVSSDPSSASALDAAFGSDLACIGISVTGNPTIFADRDDIIFWIKSPSYWFGFESEALITGSKNLSGTISTAKRRISKFSTSTRDKPTFGTYTSSNSNKGDMVLHQESDDSDDGFVGLVIGYLSTGYASMRGLDFGDEDKEISSTTSTTPTTPAAMGTIQTFSASSSTINATYLDSAIAVAEGSIGYNTNEHEIYIKANGYWWSINMDTQAG